MATAMQIAPRWRSLTQYLLRLSTRADFRAWAARFAPTRPIARRRARQLFDLCAGFVYTQVLLACVRLEAFEHLAEGAKGVPELARRWAMPVDAATRLLDAAVALRLVRKCRDARYALGPLGAALVGNDAVIALVEHHALLYADLEDPVAVLRGGARGELARYWPYAAANDPARLDSAAVDAYSTLMSASQPLVSDEILDAFNFSRYECLLDVGGGSGTFVASVAARAPHLRLMLFDLPAVAQLARQNISRLGIGDRASIHAGSFFTDALPLGADVVTLVRVLHDHDDAAVRAILGAVRRALPMHGVLLIAEPMAGTRGAEAMGDAYFGFYLLAMGKGRPRTVRRLQDLLVECGFDGGRLVHTHLPIQTRLLLARPV